MTAPVITDIHVVANEILNQARGGASSQVDVSDIVSCAELTKTAGYNPIINSLTQVISRTVFSVRPYNRRFAGIYKTPAQWGAFIRKVNFIDKDYEADNTFFNESGAAYSDGEVPPSMYKLNKPKALETYISDQRVIQKSLTTFKDQLDTAFEGPAELQSFLGGAMTNALDVMEQGKESLAREVIVDLIGGTVKQGGKQVVHLLSEYAEQSGITLTKTTMYQPENFMPFYQWVSARIANLSDKMEERTSIYHMNPKVNGEVAKIMRHTPKNLQHMYLLSDFANYSQTMAISNTFNADKLKSMDYETIGFWQTPADPSAINAKVKYLANAEDEDNAKPVEAVFESDDVVGVIFDDEACGICPITEYALNTPMHARASMYNTYWHSNNRYYVDNTENCVVLMLD